MATPNLQIFRPKLWNQQWLLSYSTSQQPRNHTEPNHFSSCVFSDGVSSLINVVASLCLALQSILNTAAKMLKKKKKSQITSLSKLSKGSSSHSKSSEWSTRPCIMCSNLSNLICCTKLLAVPITLLDTVLPQGLPICSRLCLALFSQSVTWSASGFPSGLYSDCTFSARPSLTTSLPPAISYHQLSIPLSYLISHHSLYHHLYQSTKARLFCDKQP